jgi:Asp-tRNA(Asn)/Glu-tRNA(Gln) amidotransferase A subunit family amidase
VIPIADSSSTTSFPDLPPPRKRRTENAYLTTGDYHELYRSGKLTPTEVVDALLPHIRRDTNPPGEHSVAFLDSKVDIIRAAAAASTQRYKEGQPLSPLDGVPVAVKDEVELEGYQKSLGSKVDFTGKVGGTSWCVKKWEEAGAVIIGKTNMHELGLGKENRVVAILSIVNLQQVL